MVESSLKGDTVVSIFVRSEEGDIRAESLLVSAIRPAQVSAQSPVVDRPSVHSGSSGYNVRTGSTRVHFSKIVKAGVMAR